MLRNIEGEQFDTWYSRVTAFLVRTQEQEGDEAGSWTQLFLPERLTDYGATAQAILCLQIPYRYLPLYRSE